MDYRLAKEFMKNSGVGVTFPTPLFFVSIMFSLANCYLLKVFFIIHKQLIQHDRIRVEKSIEFANPHPSVAVVSEKSVEFCRAEVSLTMMNLLLVRF
ncbi:hypothetical protein ACQKFM_18350 [Paenibacillus xylanexedens]|uniref:hypothetical protein n=1 Tax=Paenibacillus xylanexedens TaxID=528191 RepID=UPI003D07D7CD